MKSAFLLTNSLSQAGSVSLWLCGLLPIAATFHSAQSPPYCPI